MLFDIDHLIQQQDFSQLEAPFTKQEIDFIVSQMPNDKSAGPLFIISLTPKIAFL
jgi:hypothetical protein